MKDLMDFFGYLSQRFYNETDLSDITWTLCKANQKFRNMFFKFCFKRKVPEMKKIDREFQSNDCRPDFVCTDENGHKYIIEIKINDKSNFHFEQYRDEFPNASCAFISKYNGKKFCDDNSNWSITTWKKFIDYLKDKIDKNDMVINGYIKYLKNITRYTEVKRMNLNEVTSLPIFNSILEDIINEYDEKKLEFSNRSKSFFQDRYGRYISFNDKSNNNILFWIGIWLIDSPYLYLFFETNDVRFKKIIERRKEGEYFYIEKEEEFSFFYLKNSYHDILFSEDYNIEEQKDIISNFLQEILERI